MAGARAGDRQALDTLLRRHFDRIHMLCRRMCGNDADADDATQDALLAVVRGLDRFDGRAAFATWVYRVTANACLDELRRRRRRPLPADDDQWAGTATGPLAGAGSRSPAPDESEATATRLDIDNALAHLPPDWRAAVVLRDLCGFDYAAIAETLDIPPGTVRSRIARGRSRLAELLAGGNRRPAPERPTP